MADELKMAVASNIKRLRNSRGISAVELSDKIQVSTSTVSDWENGRKLPRSGALRALADYFKVSIEDLMSDKSVAERAKIPYGSEIIDLEGLLNSEIRLVFEDRVLAPKEKEVALNVLKAMFGSEAAS